MSHKLVYKTFNMAANRRLPDEVINRILGGNTVNEDDRHGIVEKFMNPLLQCKRDENINPSRLFVYLDKLPGKKWPKPRPHSRKTLSYKDRRKLGLYSLGKNSLKYRDLLPLHTLWEDYMGKYINLDELRGRDCNDDDNLLQQAGVKLYRADYHGAELFVKRSICPGYVAKSGIVAMETKNCFILVGKDNVTRKIPKASCEFSFELNKLKFSFFGKNFISRPADRSSKKIKMVHMPYL